MKKYIQVEDPEALADFLISEAEASDAEENEEFLADLAVNVIKGKATLSGLVKAALLSKKYLYSRANEVLLDAVSSNVQDGKGAELEEAFRRAVKTSDVPYLKIANQNAFTLLRLSINKNTTCFYLVIYRDSIVGHGLTRYEAWEVAWEEAMAEGGQYEDFESWQQSAADNGYQDADASPLVYDLIASGHVPPASKTETICTDEGYCIVRLR